MNLIAFYHELLNVYIFHELLHSGFIFDQNSNNSNIGSLYGRERSTLWTIFILSSDISNAMMFKIMSNDSNQSAPSVKMLLMLQRFHL